MYACVCVLYVSLLLCCKYFFLYIFICTFLSSHQTHHCQHITYITCKTHYSSIMMWLLLSYHQIPSQVLGAWDGECHNTEIVYVSLSCNRTLLLTSTYSPTKTKTDLSLSGAGGLNEPTTWVNAVYLPE